MEYEQVIFNAFLQTGSYICVHVAAKLAFQQETQSLIKLFCMADIGTRLQKYESELYNYMAAAWCSVLSTSTIPLSCCGGATQPG